MRDSHKSVNEKPLHFNLSVSSNGLFCLQQSLSTSLSPLKRMTLLCSPKLSLVFHRLHIPNCNSLLFLNIYFFFCKITVIFIVIFIVLGQQYHFYKFKMCVNRIYYGIYLNMKEICPK